MAADNREKLINSLAEAMGAVTPSTTMFADSRYDKETGTFYCNGHMITAGMIDKAIIYYSNMYQRAAKSNEHKEMMLIYELALESIKLLRDNPNAINKFRRENIKKEA